ncbi:MAG: beta-phosphoglucomutase [Firmicutes bacterium]|nr:beta-phosphoglucomutase [Bacillota bacterium]
MAALPEAVIFDLDGVLTRTDRYHYLAWRRLAEELGLSFDEALNDRLRGVGRLDSLRIIMACNGRRCGEEELRRLAEVKNEYYREFVAGMSPADVSPGAVAVLKNLREMGIKIGLASASKNAPFILDRLDLRRFFDHIVDPGRITRGKPDPEIFLAAAEGLGAAPCRCVGVEDAAVGVRAIKAAGMYAIGVGDPGILKEADEVIQDLKEFRLDRYLNGQRRAQPKANGGDR